MVPQRERVEHDGQACRSLEGTRGCRCIPTIPGRAVGSDELVIDVEGERYLQLGGRQITRTIARGDEVDTCA